MKRCLFTQHNMCRSPLADRSNPPAAIIQNDGANDLMRTQSVKCLRQSWHKLAAEKRLQDSRPRDRGNVSLTRRLSFPIA